MTDRPRAVLLDTCAVIWLVNGMLDSSPARPAIVFAGRAEGIHVSTASAWEIGLLSRLKPRDKPGVQFLPDPKTWFASVLSRPGIKLAAMTPAIAIDACHLPGDVHGDPADRFLIATARHLGMPIVTSDRKIIAYAETGFVGVVPC